MQTITLNCPQAGSIQYSLTADANSQITESNENNNQWAYTVQCATPPQQLPDIATNASTSALGGSHTVGSQFNVPVSTRNIGTSSTQNASTTRVTFNGNQIAALSVPSLAAGAINTQTVSVTCPQTGTLTFALAGDYNNNVAESDESNNGWTYSVSCASSGGPGPDLIAGVDSHSLGELYDWHQVGDPFFVAVYTQNLNPAYQITQQSTTRVTMGDLIDEDPTASPLYSSTITGFYPSLGVPDGGVAVCQQPGNFWFNTTADYYNNVSESNEGNNQNNYYPVVCMSSIPPGPDLKADASTNELLLPQVVGVPFSVPVYTRNVNNLATANATTTRVQFGSLTANLNVPAGLAPHAINTQQAAFTCPAAGDYYFTVTADANNAEYEQYNEDNNVWRYNVSTAYQVRDKVHCIASQSTYTLTITANSTAPDVLEPVHFDYTISPNVQESQITFSWYFGPYRCYDGVAANGDSSASLVQVTPSCVQNSFGTSSVAVYEPGLRLENISESLCSPAVFPGS